MSSLKKPKYGKVEATHTRGRTVEGYYNVATRPGHVDFAAL